MVKQENVLRFVASIDAQKSLVRLGEDRRRLWFRGQADLNGIRYRANNRQRAVERGCFQQAQYHFPTAIKKTKAFIAMPLLK